MNRLLFSWDLCHLLTGLSSVTVCALCCLYVSVNVVSGCTLQYPAVFVTTVGRRMPHSTLVLCRKTKTAAKAPKVPKVPESILKRREKLAKAKANAKAAAVANKKVNFLIRLSHSLSLYMYTHA